MTAPVGYTTLRMVAGPDTTAEDQAWAGQVVIVPGDYPLGSGPTNPGRLLGVYGHTQVGAGTPPLEWVMGSQFSAADIAALNAIPGAEGWTDPAARLVFRNQGRRIVLLGVANADVRDILTRLFNAAKAEVLAEIAAGRTGAGR